MDGVGDGLLDALGELFLQLLRDDAVAGGVGAGCGVGHCGLGLRFGKFG